MTYEYTLTSNKQTFFVDDIAGVVMGTDRHQYATVHQGRSTPLMDGGVLPGQVWSEHHETNTVWVREPSNKEQELNLSGLGAPVRPGHIVSVSRVSTDGKRWLIYALRNHTTGAIHGGLRRAISQNQGGILALKPVYPTWPVLVATILLAMFGAMGGWKGALLGGGIGFLFGTVVGVVLGMRGVRGIVTEVSDICMRHVRELPDCTTTPVIKDVFAGLASLAGFGRPPATSSTTSAEIKALLDTEFPTVQLPSPEAFTRKVNYSE
jgi:hypothetical protein